MAYGRHRATPICRAFGAARPSRRWNVAKFAGKEFLTDEEVAAIEKAAAASLGNDQRASRGTERDVSGAYHQAFQSAGKTYLSSKRSSLIVDRPDGEKRGPAPDDPR
jgi:hypothetical protein